TALPSSVYHDNDFRFVLNVTIPGLAHGYRNGDPHDLMISAPDVSHAHITPDSRLTQYGPRRLWDDIETIHQMWQSLDAPPRERFGLTVTRQHQTIWLDTPESEHRWQAITGQPAADRYPG
ncbi:MAG: hypothetical protein ACRDSH_05610, partial [Pseudonocardiaceae bacterium]